MVHFLVINYFYDTSDDEYCLCNSKEQAIRVASNIVLNTMMDGAGITKKELLKIKKPEARLEAWADYSNCYSMEWSFGSIGGIKIVKIKTPTKQQLVEK